MRVGLRIDDGNVWPKNDGCWSLRAIGTMIFWQRSQNVGLTVTNFCNLMFEFLPQWLMPVALRNGAAFSSVLT